MDWILNVLGVVRYFVDLALFLKQIGLWKAVAFISSCFLANTVSDLLRERRERAREEAREREEIEAIVRAQNEEERGNNALQIEEEEKKAEEKTEEKS